MQIPTLSSLPEFKNNYASPLNNEVLLRLFQKRNLSIKEVQELTSKNLRDLPDLTQMHDLEKAARRLIHALDHNENIAIYGDYDVDGTTACALLYQFFKGLGKLTYAFQPGRFAEGYGLHVSSIDEAISKQIDVMITVDCGITNNEAAVYATEKGLDLIITDHHTDGREEMPRAFAVVNPNRRDEDKESPLRFLAGVGVAFALCLKIKQIFDEEKRPPLSVYPLLPYVAIGTICDLVKLTPMNLKLARHGLKLLKENRYPGLAVFFNPEEDFNRDIVSSEKLSFSVGPLINSKGRLEHPREALELLISDDPTEARRHYLILSDSNTRRKLIQSKVLEEAKLQVLRELTTQNLNIVIVYSSQWHEGVVGIVASKLVELFRVPAIVLTDSEDKRYIKGSARTAGTLSIFDVLQTAAPLYHRFGGHRAAAGLTLPRENFREWRSLIESTIATIPSILRTGEDSFDIDIHFSEITPDLLRSLEFLEPFGQGNEAPLFRLQGALVESYQVLKGSHVRFTLVSPSLPGVRLQAISFFYLEKTGNPSPEQIMNKQDLHNLSIFFQLKSEFYRGKEFMKLHIQRISLF